MKIELFPIFRNFLCFLYVLVWYSVLEFTDFRTTITRTVYYIKHLISVPVKNFSIVFFANKSWKLNFFQKLTSVLAPCAVITSSNHLSLSWQREQSQNSPIFQKYLLREKRLRALIGISFQNQGCFGLPKLNVLLKKIVLPAASFSKWDSHLLTYWLSFVR